MAYDPNSCKSRFPVILVIMPSPLSSHLAGLHVPKKRFFLFLLTQWKKDFQPVKSLYFCVGLQKKKSCLKRTDILEHVNRLIVSSHA